MNYLNFETGDSNSMYNWGGFRNFLLGVGVGGGGVQTLFQKRLLNFFEVNYFFPTTPTPPHPLPPDAVANKIPTPVKKVTCNESHRKIHEHCIALLLSG